MLNSQTASHLIDAAVDAIACTPSNIADLLDDIPAAIYVTDQQGTITYFNEACVKLAGRRPTAGTDKWCVTWKLFTLEGKPLPHDVCPMAVAVKEQRAVRDCEAIAERPDGTRFRFRPFPTPLFAADGTSLGAVNLLLDTTHEPNPEYWQAQAERGRQLASAMTEPDIAQTLFMMAATYDERSLR